MFKELDTAHVVTLFGKYLEAAGQAKLEDTSFLTDVRPLLSADEAIKFDDKAERAAFVTVANRLVGACTA